MLTVKISKPAVQKQSKAGSKYFVQTGVIQLFDREGELEECPRKIEFMCDAGYQPGEYELSPASFGVGQYDKLEIRRLVLSPKGTGANPRPAAK